MSVRHKTGKTLNPRRRNLAHLHTTDLLDYIRTLPWEPNGYGQIIPFYWIEEIDRPFNTDAFSLDQYGYSMAQIYYLNRILEEATDRQAKRLFASVYRTETGIFINGII